MAKSTCAACGEVFKSVTGFDKHRIGGWGDAVYASKDKHQKNAIGYMPHTRRCMTVEEMLAAGMSKNDKGLWIASAYEQSAHADADDEREEQIDGQIS